MRWKIRRPRRAANTPRAKEMLMNRSVSTLHSGSRLPLELGDKCTAFERWRAMCPYGQWTTAEGREVLFNRTTAPSSSAGPVSIASLLTHARGCRG